MLCDCFILRTLCCVPCRGFADRAPHLPTSHSMGSSTSSSTGMDPNLAVSAWEVLLVFELCDRGSLRSALDSGLFNAATHATNASVGSSSEPASREGSGRRGRRVQEPESSTASETNSQHVSDDKQSITFSNIYFVQCTSNE